MGGERAEEKRMGGSNQDEGGYTAGEGVGRWWTGQSERMVMMVMMMVANCVMSGREEGGGGMWL